MFGSRVTCRAFHQREGRRCWPLYASKLRCGAGVDEAPLVSQARDARSVDGQYSHHKGLPLSPFLLVSTLARQVFSLFSFFRVFSHIHSSISHQSCRLYYSMYLFFIYIYLFSSPTSEPFSVYFRVFQLGTRLKFLSLFLFYLELFSDRWF